MTCFEALHLLLVLFHPKMLLIDVSIEGFKNMWRVALQVPGPQ